MLFNIDTDYTAAKDAMLGLVVALGGAVTAVVVRDPESDQYGADPVVIPIDQYRERGLKDGEFIAAVVWNPGHAPEASCHPTQKAEAAAVIRTDGSVLVRSAWRRGSGKGFGFAELGHTTVEVDLDKSDKTPVEVYESPHQVVSAVRMYAAQTDEPSHVQQLLDAIVRGSRRQGIPIDEIRINVVHDHPRGGSFLASDVLSDQTWYLQPDLCRVVSIREVMLGPGCESHHGISEWALSVNPWDWNSGVNVTAFEGGRSCGQAQLVGVEGTVGFLTSDPIVRRSSVDGVVAYVIDTARQFMSRLSEEYDGYDSDYGFDPYDDDHVYTCGCVNRHDSLCEFSVSLSER